MNNQPVQVLGGLNFEGINMYLIQENEIKEHDYVTYARQFDSYRWFKPVLTMFFFAIFFIFFNLLITAAAGAADFMITGGDWKSFLGRLNQGYDNIGTTDPVGCALTLGSMASAIPAFWFARGIVRERPYSSYMSSRGGWGWWIFFKCLIIALLVSALPNFVYEYYYLGHKTIESHFVNYGLYFLIVLCPLQCIGEEYLFRGLINQALGAWFRVPVIAIVLSAIGFAALHPYNVVGQVAILISGIALGVSSWFGRGLEVSSALHIANNMTAFLMDGYGISKIGSEIDIKSAVFSVIIDIVYAGIIVFLFYKTDWFDRAKFDDAQSHNAYLEAKRQKKAAKKAAKKAKRQAKKEAKAA